MNRLGFFAAILSQIPILFLPGQALAAGRRFFAPAVCHQAVAVPVVAATAFEVLVPVSAISFQYIEQVQVAHSQASVGVSMGTAPPVNHGAVTTASPYAALPYDEQPIASYAAAGHRSGIAASVLQNRCASCHLNQAKGGVRLWDQAGNFAPNRNGAALSNLQVYKAVVVNRTMPLGGTMSPFELAAMDELLN